MAFFIFQHLRQQYDTLCPTLCSNYPEIFPPDLYTWDQYLWACELWYSHGMKIVCFDGKLKTCLVPIAGLLNHSVWFLNYLLFFFSSLFDVGFCFTEGFFRLLIAFWVNRTGPFFNFMICFFAPFFTLHLFGWLDLCQVKCRSNMLKKVQVWRTWHAIHILDSMHSKSPIYTKIQILDSVENSVNIQKILDSLHFKSPIDVASPLCFHCF